MNKIYQEIEILTITYKSDHIIEKCLSNIDQNFKITVVENSNNKEFQRKIEKRKNTKCILTNSNLGFGSAFNIGAKQINSKYIPNKLIIGSTTENNLPLLKNRFIKDKTLIYVCVNKACKMPTESIEESVSLINY